jgi:hypothetical protein
MPLVVIIGGMLGALYVAASILMDEGNQLAGLFFYLLLGSGILGLLAPRLSFFLFIFQTAYLDLFKRLMIIAGTVTYSDLFWVLGIAPITVAGIAAGLVARIFFGQSRADASDVRRLAVAVVLNTALALLVYVKGGGIGGTVREVANGSSYILLLFIVPLIFSTPESVARCTRFIILVYVPVVIYGIYQQSFGFQEFEIDYLKTGLSIEVKLLEADRVRAFSTLNSATSLSVVASSLAALSLSLAMVGRRTQQTLLPLPIAVGIALLCVGAWVASTVRAGILLLPVAMIGTFLFRKPGTTKAFYGVLITAFATLVATASYIYSNIELWTRQLLEMVGGGTFASYMVNMNTYKDRLHGFMNVLANPKAYTLFGMSEAAAEDSTFMAHDPLSSALLNYGIVPLSIGLLLGGLALWRFHRVIFTMRDPTLQFFAASFLANAAGNLAVSMINGNLLGTFPVNVFFWMSLAFSASLRRTDTILERQSAKAKLEKPAQPPIPPPGRHTPAPRFAPVPRTTAP